jgi:16S rRNA G1207 methylase RsmC
VKWINDYWKNVLVPLFKLRQDSTILDIGCGLGFLGRNLAEFNPHGKTIGIDLDAKLIDAARKIAESSACPMMPLISELAVRMNCR